MIPVSKKGTEKSMTVSRPELIFSEVMTTSVSWLISSATKPFQLPLTIPPHFPSLTLERKDKLFIHCKNFDALSALIKTKLTIFYHEKEQYTIVSNGKIWAHNIDEICNECIIPLLSKEELITYLDKNKNHNAWGICSDFVELIK